MDREPVSNLVYPVLAYVAGPYRDRRGAYYVRGNIRAAEEVAVDLWRMGIPTICPHLNTALFDGAEQDEVWLAGDLVILRRCDLVVMTPHWGLSIGARAERELAQSLGLPVFEWPLDRSEIRMWAEEALDRAAPEAAGQGRAEAASR